MSAWLTLAFLSGDLRGEYLICPLWLLFANFILRVIKKHHHLSIKDFLVSLDFNNILSAHI